MKNGGYIIVSVADTNIYEKVNSALINGKPILWYEDANTCYYIDTISGGEVTSEIIDDEEVFTYHDIILTKGGKTITITSSNVVTENGEVQEKLYYYYFDASDFEVDGGTLTTNTRMSFVCNIPNLNGMALTDIPSIKVVVLSGDYLNTDETLLHILVLSISVDNNKLKIEAYQDGADNNELVLTGDQNYIYELL